MTTRPSDETVKQGCRIAVLSMAAVVPIFFAGIWVATRFGFFAGAVFDLLLLAPVVTRFRKWNNIWRDRWLEETSDT